MRELQQCHEQRANTPSVIGFRHGKSTLIGDVVLQPLLKTRGDHISEQEAEDATLLLHPYGSWSQAENMQEEVSKAEVVARLEGRTSEPPRFSKQCLQAHVSRTLVRLDTVLKARSKRKARGEGGSHAISHPVVAIQVNQPLQRTLLQPLHWALSCYPRKNGTDKEAERVAACVFEPGRVQSGVIWGRQQPRTVH
eukprot:3518131-Prymnesium_polylepis.1